MLFKELDSSDLAKTREVWEQKLDAFEEQMENVRPSRYWSALDAAAGRISGSLEARQFGLFEGGNEHASALVALLYIDKRPEPYLKIREIRLAPELSNEVNVDLSIFRKASDAIAAIIGKVLELSETGEFQAEIVKLYGDTAVEMQMFAHFVNSADSLQANWGLKISSHGHWLQFEKKSVE